VAVSKVAEVTAARASGVRSPTATFTSWTPALNDLVILFCTDLLQGRTITIPATWVNPLGGTTDVESDAHEMCAVYHWVTQAEVDAGTLTYTATDLYDASVTDGRTSGIVLRGVDTAAPIDGSGTWSITTNSTSHHFPAVVAGDVTFSDDMVVRAVAHDGTGAYTNPAAHTSSTNATATQSVLVSTRDALTTAGVEVADTTVTCGTTGEGVGISLAVAKIPPPPKDTAASIAETPAESTWTGTGTSKSTSTGGNGSGTVSWQTGDTVCVFGATAQASSTTLGTPTHSGANLPAFSAVGAAVGSGAQCWAHTWSATATGSGSSVISETATSSSDPWGIIAWVIRGSDGVGIRATLVSAAKDVSLTRSDAHSLVLEIIADYAAGSATLTWTPTGETQREATQAAGLYTVGVADWGDQGSAGATSYGVSAGFDATGPLTKIALEILGTIATVTPAQRPILRSPYLIRASTW